MQNLKIKNSQKKEYKGIIFKSKLEVSCYKLLETSGLDFKYEPSKYLLFEGFYTKGSVYSPSNISRGVVGKELKLNTNKIRSITYTPDFEIYCGKFTVYLDVKGMANDVYPIKKKMFLKYLEDKGDYYMFFEPHNIKQITQMLNIIKNELV